MRTAEKCPKILVLNITALDIEHQWQNLYTCKKIMRAQDGVVGKIALWKKKEKKKAIKQEDDTSS